MPDLNSLPTLAEDKAHLTCTHCTHVLSGACYECIEAALGSFRREALDGMVREFEREADASESRSNGANLRSFASRLRGEAGRS